MKKVLVLGSMGMAGHVVSQYLIKRNKYKVYRVARKFNLEQVDKELDILDLDLLKAYLKDIKPDYVVNCIGILLSKSSEDLLKAIQINSYFPHLLSELGRNYGFKLIHISTDCVFSGNQGNYSEESFRDGDDDYARTKALGEVNNNKDLTIRTSIIGPELKKNGIGLLDWFFKQEEPIQGYSKVYWTGVTTLELAKQIDSFMDQDISGLFHLCPEEKISKYELLKLCIQIWDKNLEIKENRSFISDKSLICSRDDFQYYCSKPTYAKMLHDLKIWMAENPQYYSHYLV